MKANLYSIITLLLLPVALSAAAMPDAGMVSGRVVSTDKEIVDFATVYLKGTTYGCTTDEEGLYHLKAPVGNYTLVVSAIGYRAEERTIAIAPGERTKLSLTLRPQATQLNEIVVTSNGVSRVKRSAFNAVAVDTKALQNSTKTLGDALMQLPGMKMRESGGMGSDMQIMLDGFSGKHVKVFIDGVPQEGAGKAFDLNNIPAGFAERIEVYKGVVPVGFGTDALGGVINIVTNKQRRRWFVDASYSYGSFNTHKSYVNFGQTFRGGLMYEINAFQNYSDNSYYVDNWVKEFNLETNQSYPINENKMYRVRRFHDTFHNEAVIGKIGFVDKPWADRLVLSVAYSRFYKEIQTGVRQRFVFGEKHRRGWSFAPKLEYRKRDLLVKNLDLALTANYNHNLTQNVDTSRYEYNWRGQRILKGGGRKGEQGNQLSDMKNMNWNATATLNYRMGKAHTFTLNHVFSSFDRTSQNLLHNKSTAYNTNFDIPKQARKNITGLSYRLMPGEKWNISAFGKYYNQFSRGPVSLNADGIGNDTLMTAGVSAFGYGAAGTYYISESVQTKLSYEKALRMPGTDELFGDGDLEAGKADLRPERSHNLNLNLSFDRHFDKHALYAEGSLIYRHTDDYIRRKIGTIGGSSYGTYENHGRVVTRGANLSLRYSYARWFSIGGTFNYMDARDREKKLSGDTGQNSSNYGQRIPNQPYMYANMDATFFWHNLLAKGNTLTVSYDSYWQEEFPLYWENYGDPATKSRVPEQFAHNVSIAYSLKKGRYNISFECRNLTDAKLYDNFSLQKAGRAFYAKVRVYLQAPQPTK